LYPDIQPKAEISPQFFYSEALGSLRPIMLPTYYPITSLRIVVEIARFVLKFDSNSLFTLACSLISYAIRKGRTNFLDPEAKPLCQR
jgi:hypothetical protein